MSNVLISSVAKCTNTQYTVDHNTIGATEQQIWHKKLSD